MARSFRICRARPSTNATSRRNGRTIKQRQASCSLRYDFEITESSGHRRPLSVAPACERVAEPVHPLTRRWQFSRARLPRSPIDCGRRLQRRAVWPAVPLRHSGTGARKPCTELTNVTLHETDKRHRCISGGNRGNVITRVRLGPPLCRRVGECVSSINDTFGRL